MFLFIYIQKARLILKITLNKNPTVYRPIISHIITIAIDCQNVNKTIPQFLLKSLRNNICKKCMIVFLFSYRKYLRKKSQLLFKNLKYVFKKFLEISSGRVF